MIFTWEEKANNPGAPLVKCATELPSCFRAAVFSEQSTTFQTKLNLGILWPVKVYKQHFKTDPPKGSIKSIVHNGQPVRGVIMEAEHGTPIGSITLKQVCGTGHRFTKEVESSTQAVRGMKQVQETYDSLQDKSALVVTKGGGGGSDADGGGEAWGSVRLKNKRDEDDILDQLWMPVISQTSSAAPKNHGKPPKPPKSEEKSKPGKQQRELQVSEEVLLKAKHAFEAVQQNTAGLQRLTSVLNLISGRLRDNIVPCYAADYDAVSVGAGETRSGIQVLEDLRVYQKKLESCRTLVACLTSETSPNTDEVVSYLDDAEAAGLEDCKELVNAAWKCLLRHAWAQKDFAQWAILLDVQSRAFGSGTHPLQKRIDNVHDAGTMSTFLEEEIMNSLILYLRQSGQSEMVKSVMVALGPVAIYFPDSDFKDDLLNFAKVALVTSSSSEDVIKASQAKEQLLTAEKSRFCRALRLFGTGQDLVAAVDVELLAVKEDEAMLSQLKTWKEASAAWARPPELSTSHAGHVEYSAVLCKQFTAAYQASRLVKSKMSKRFADEHAEELKQEEAILQEVVDTLFAGLKEKYHEVLAEVCVDLTAMCKGTVKNRSVDKAGAIWGSFMVKTCPPLPDLHVDSFAGDAAVEVIKNWLQDQTKRWQVCATGCSRLFAPQLEPGDSSLISFVEMLSAEDSFSDVRELEVMKQFMYSCMALFVGKARALLTVKLFRPCSVIADLLKGQTNLGDLCVKVRQYASDSEDGGLCNFCLDFLSTYRPVMRAEDVQELSPSSPARKQSSVQAALAAGASPFGPPPKSADGDLLLVAPFLLQFVKERCQHEKKLPDPPAGQSSSSSGDGDRENEKGEIDVQEFVNYRDTCLSKLDGFLVSVGRLQALAKQVNKIISGFSGISCADSVQARVENLGGLVSEGVEEDRASVVALAHKFYEVLGSRLSTTMDNIKVVEGMFVQLDTNKEILDSTHQTALLAQVQSPLASEFYKLFRWINEETSGLRTQLESVCGSHFYDTMPLYQRAGRLMCSMTCCIALWRTLREHETREQLMKLSIRGLKSKGHLLAPYDCVNQAFVSILGSRYDYWGTYCLEKKAKSSAPPAVETIRIADGAASVEEGPQKKLRMA